MADSEHRERGEQFTGLTAVLLNRAVRLIEARSEEDEGFPLRYVLPAKPGGAGAVVRRAKRPGAVNDPAQLETYRTSFLERGQLGTYFTISGEPAQILVEQLADDPRAHLFRRETGRHLEPRWPTRARSLISCGEAGARCDCASCGASHVFPYRCGCRACPTCAHATSAIKCEKIARLAGEAEELHLLGPWDGIGPAREKGWRILTLTTIALRTEAERYDPDVLRAYVLAVRKAWGKFWRSTSWGNRINDVTASGGPTKRVRRDTLAAMGIEVGPGGMVHIHAAVYGEYIPSEELAELWSAACEYGGFVKVNRIRYRKGPRKGELLTNCDKEGVADALHEVLKYLTKGHKDGDLYLRASHAAAAEYALQNQRRIDTCGALRLVPKIDEKDLATNQQECQSCGGVGAWTWRGTRAPHYVQRNGGFGLTTIIDSQDEALRREQESDIETDFKLEREPGGRFYGGAPPPWMDDDDDWDSKSEGHEPITGYHR